jgi:hypothetical protein
MSTDEIVKTLTLLCVGVSTSLAVIIYFRNKKMELENSLFKSRLEAIGSIQMELTIFLQQIDKTKVILKNLERYNDNKLYDLSLEFDDKIYKCEASIVKYAVYFSDDTAGKLIRFAQNFYDQHKGITEELLDGLNMYEDFIIKNVEEVINHLRKETGIEEIHNSLMKRFRKENK